MLLTHKKTAHSSLTPVHTFSDSSTEKQTFHPFYWDDVRHSESTHPFAQVLSRKATSAELEDTVGMSLITQGTFIRMVLAGTSLFEICRLTGLTQRETHAMASHLGLLQHLYKNTYHSE